jgi:hypothetical protein
MAIKLNVGTSKKIGTNDYGSLGAHCGIEVELDQLALEQPNAFHDRMSSLFETCRAAVDHELQQKGSAEIVAHNSTPSSANRIIDSGGNNGNGTRRTARGASEKQLKFIRTLASVVQGLDNNQLESLSERMYNSSVDHLTSIDASALIDTLQGIKQGRLQLDRLLGNGGTGDEF